jgi:hypothetical protein
MAMNPLGAGGASVELQRVEKDQEATYLDSIQNQGYEHLGEPLQIEFNKDINEIRAYVQTLAVQLNATHITEVENPPAMAGQPSMMVYYIWRAPQPQSEPQPFACPYCTRPFMAIPGSQTQVVACPTCGGANIIPAMDSAPAPVPAPAPAAPEPPLTPPAAATEEVVAPEPPAAPAAAVEEVVPPAAPTPPPAAAPPATTTEQPETSPTAAAEPPAEPTQAAKAATPTPPAPAPTSTQAPAATAAPASAPASATTPPPSTTPALATATTPATTAATPTTQASTTAPAATAQATPSPAPAATAAPSTPTPAGTATATPATANTTQTEEPATENQSNPVDYNDYYTQQYSANMPSFDYFSKKVETVQKKPEAPLIPQEYENSYNQKFTTIEQAIKSNMQKLADLLANPQNQIKFYDSGELMYPKVTIRKGAYNHLETREMDLIMIKDGVNDYKIIANESHGAASGSLMPMQDELFAIKTLGHASYRAMEDWAYLDENQKLAISKCVYAFMEIYIKKLPKPEEEAAK